MRRPLANVIEDLIPAALHNTGQYENNRCECGHGRLKARLRPMRGLKTNRTASVVIRGHAFVQNLRRGHYESGVDAAPVFPAGHRIRGTQSRDLIEPTIRPRSCMPGDRIPQRCPTEFPICGTGADFNTSFSTQLWKSKQQRSELYTTQSLKAMRTVQSFWSTEQYPDLGLDVESKFRLSAMRRLDELSNLDKHRRIPLTAWVPDTF